MKQSQFLGWVKKAYPDLRSVKKENGDVWLSNGQFLQVVSRSDNVLEFHKLEGRDLAKPIVVSEDSDIVRNIRGLWGEPKVAFTVPKTNAEPEPAKKEPTPEPKKEQPAKMDKDNLNREAVIKKLEEEFPGLIEISKVPGGKAVHVNGSKLVLYDYGISSKPSEFIPWAREEEVRTSLTKFISINKQHHE
jgi:hypothetical protein